LNDKQIEEIKKMESENPMLFDEVANRKKWTYVSKNA